MRSPALRHFSTRPRSSLRSRILLLLMSVRPRRRRSLIQRTQQLLPRNRSRAPFHYDNSARVIGQLPRFFRGGTGGKSRAERRNHRIARTRHIRHLVRPEDRNIHWRVLLIESDHPIASSRNQQRLQLHSFHNLLPSPGQLSPVLPDANAQRRFHLRLIWSSGSRSYVFQQSITRIQNHWDVRNSSPRPLPQRIHNRRTRRPIPIIRNQQRIRRPQIFSRRQKQFARQMPIRRILRLAIPPPHLLPRVVRHARQNPRLRHRRIRLVLNHAADWDALVAKTLHEQSSRFVVANCADRQHVYSQIDKIINRIGTAPRQHGTLAMLQDEHWSLARHSRDFSVNKFIGDQIPKHRNRDLRERLNNLSQPLDFF